MAADDETEIRVPESSFGKCCEGLKDAMSGEDFDPLIGVGDDGVLYMAIGLVEVDEDGPGMLDHPVFFCPFCGESLQTPESVAAMSSDEGSAEIN
jgi:hypothetical protein